ncbi:hypothetical protein ABW17_14140 [Mycobacterium nebraskense]|uniref:hypothetical protein n=1 Tax=Mycobacterium nebraskense TaxID=244292 RepID=UPI000641A3CD|nr:hypothetical protein [Mycobacterium nebraskense]KLO41456.1 hypothetical protein ABW17_14140 [Mycobacterium nebraskense]
MTDITSHVASGILGVSPHEVRRLAAEGRIQGSHYIGRTLVLDAAAVHRLAREQRQPGRPWSARVAWAALNLLSGKEARWLSPSERTRLMHRLRKITAEELEYLAMHRAWVRRFRGRTSTLDDLESYIVPTGGSALDDTQLGLLGLAGATRSLDGYVPLSELEILQEKFGLIEDPSGNVTLRGVSVEDAFEDGITPRAAVFLDLAGSLNTRESAAGLREATTLIAAVAA